MKDKTSCVIDKLPVWLEFVLLPDKQTSCVIDKLPGVVGVCSTPRQTNLMCDR